MTINLMNSLPYKYQDILLVSKDNYKLDNTRIESMVDRNIQILNDDYS